ncbi:MPN396 family protein [Mycoplasma bradburyae]|uniref:Bifunctional preprotein translocase subunit SecD/SecF n=1 Tax=Mycoplasma bradburyae TaxID=2963128 RepID=A0ABT5GB99_9MOLU|nr:hypothetical protein [Mycoplasma bradburyae]MDC4182133.1 hypothetical protein [Mycoplasma bradburyae]UTS70298.1 hypothetical protein NMG68_00935 [Mycoplasma bradburyae]
MKLSFDYLLKSFIIFILLALSVIGITFGSIEASKITPKGRFYNGDIKTTIFFSPYEKKVSESQNNIVSANETFDFSKDRNQDNTKLISDQSWIDLANDYSQRLHALGFSEINVNFSNNIKLPEGTNINSSWLNSNQTLPALVVSVNKIFDKKPSERDRIFNERLKRNIQTTLDNQYNLTLETTDGYVLLDNDDLIRDSLKVIRPSAASANSGITFEVKLKNNTKFTSNSDDNKQVLEYFNNLIPKNSDYFESNGQGSVETLRHRLFVSNDTKDVLGNRNLVLWNDKVGALNYVRSIFDVVQNSNKWFSLNDSEQALWNFLHSTGGYEPSASTKNLVAPFRNANDIKLNDLYYIYAEPKAYQAATENAEKKPEEITTPQGSRNPRSSTATDFSGLFSQFILYELRTTNVDGSQSKLLTDLFPTNITLNNNGDAVLRLNQRLNIGSSYSDIDFNQANSLETLIKQTSPNTDFIVVTNDSTINEPLINKTFENFSQYQSGFLGVGIILLIIGLMMIILFKVQGFFGIFGLALSSILTFFIYSKFNGFVDLFSITGLIGVIIFNFLLQAFINLNFKRNVSNKFSLLESWKSTHNKTFLKAVDLHLILLVIGLFMTFISNYESQSIGILLIVSSLIGFFFNYGLTVLLVKIFNSINNFNPKIYLYKKTYQNLNSISGNLSKDAMKLNDLVVSIDEQIDKTFSKDYKYQIMNVKSLFALILFINVIILGIVALYNFNNRTFFINSDNLYGSLNTILISLGATSLIGLVYFLLRYQWIVLIGYLFNSLVNFSVILGMLFLSKSLISNDFGYLFLLISLFSYIYSLSNFVFVTTNLYTYFNLKEIYKPKSVKKIVNNTTVATMDLYIYSTIVATAAYFIFYAFNYGGEGSGITEKYNNNLLNLGLFSLINILLININAVFLLNPLIGLLMIKKSNTNSIYWSKISLKTKKEDKNLDQIDEQLVEDINFFKRSNKVVYHENKEN